MVTPAGAPGEYENTTQVAAADQFDIDSTPANDDGDQSEDDEDLAPISPAVIGLAKTVSSVVNHGDGTYTVTYLLTAENLGTVTLSDLELTDDVAAQLALLSPTDFVATDGTLTANLAWDGSGATNVLAAGQQLDPGASGTVSLSFLAVPGADTGPHYNAASITGTTPSGSTVTDLSTDGIDPDEDGDDGDGTVDDDGVPDESDPTPVSFDESPLIGISKARSAAPVSNGDGSFDVVYTISIENLGDVALTGVQVSDDLSATFAGAEAWEFQSVTSSTLAVSPSYNGETDTNLLTGADSLEAGSSGSLTISLIVTPGSEQGPYWNSATATGSSPAGTTVADVSQDGFDVDPDDNGDPTDNSDPTPTAFDPLGSVSGTVWADIDADAVIGATETGIADVTVQLIDPGADGVIGGGDDVVVGTAVTEADGSFVFLDVPAGDCLVLVDTGTLPFAMLETYDPDLLLDNLTAVTVVPGVDAGDNDFGYVGLFNLTMSKTVEGEIQHGSPVDFVITVTNEGPGTALGPITVTDVVPGDLPVASIASVGWACSTGQDIVCNLDGNLAAGESAVIRVTATVDVAFGDESANTAAVAVTGPVPELDLSDNTDTAVVAVDELPRTGSDLMRYAALGLLLLVAGTALVGISGRREQS